MEYDLGLDVWAGSNFLLQDCTAGPIGNIFICCPSVAPFGVIPGIVSCVGFFLKKKTSFTKAQCLQCRPPVHIICEKFRVYKFMEILNKSP